LCCRHSGGSGHADDEKNEREDRNAEVPTSMPGSLKHGR
jgi:hypothetical protein